MFCRLGLTFIFLVYFHQASAQALEAQSDQESESSLNSNPIWEYGIGLGFAYFEDYPAAGQYSQFMIPIPTFQYRGRILRADDREGAKAYLWKRGPWTLEIAGSGTPPLDSDDNQNRQGMKDLPLILALGPELVYQMNPNLQVSTGIFQAIEVDFNDPNLSGILTELKLTYLNEKKFSQKMKALTKYSVSLNGASQEYQQKYYGVLLSETTLLRPEYRARAGYFSTDFSLFQSFKKDLMAFYLGGRYSHYGFSENKKSPLHLASESFTFFIGLTYVLGESSRAEVPPLQKKAN